ncbi:MAG: peptidylprolyl isomerase, partial [Pseudomonadales bacterium]|nr:peptidylprolyl isomerase [Pseudomonadales bacterium]
PMPPIAHETTDDTGIPNERGTIAYARLAPGTAGSEFFFNVSDNTRLDAGPAEPPLDGLGYATFGRVVRGLDVLDAIQNLPADAETEIEMLQGQILGNQVTITNMTLVEE